MNILDTSFLDKSVGNSVDEMLDFCNKALELLNEWKKLMNKIQYGKLIFLVNFL